jgi:hypothetical protein
MAPILGQENREIGRVAPILPILGGDLFLTPEKGKNKLRISFILYRGGHNEGYKSG